MAPSRKAKDSDSESSGDEGSGLFDGILFWVEKPIAGHTVSKINRLLQENGGKIAKKLDEMPSHFIISPQLWARESTPGPSLLLKGIKAANEENKTEEDPLEGRAWMLQPEWLFDSISKGAMLSEMEYDYEMLQETARNNRKKVIELERKRNGNKSKFSRGERRKLQLEQQRAQAIAEAEKEMEQEKKEREQAALNAFGVGTSSQGQTVGGTTTGPDAGPSKPVVAEKPKEGSLASLSAEEFRKRAADDAAKRQQAMKSQRSDEEPDPYDQISKKVKGQTKKKSSSSAGTPSSSKPKPSQKAADMLKPGKPKAGAPPRILELDSSDEEPLSAVKKRKTS